MSKIRAGLNEDDVRVGKRGEERRGEERKGTEFLTASEQEVPKPRYPACKGITFVVPRKNASLCNLAAH